MTAEEIKFLILLTNGLVRYPYVRTIINNRRAWLQAKVGDNVIFSIHERVPAKSSWQWHWHVDKLAEATPDEWASRVFAYRRTKVMAGAVALQNLAKSLKAINEDYRGAELAQGFLYVYDLLTGGTRARIAGGRDDAWFMGRLAWANFTESSRAGSVWSGIISVMSQNPELARAMPRFAPSKKDTGTNFTGGTSGPLHALMTKVLAFLATPEAEAMFKPPPEEYRTIVPLTPPSDEERTILKIELAEDRLSYRRPHLTDCLATSKVSFKCLSPGTVPWED